MNRLMTCLALGLVVGLAPAVAQDQPPADTQSPPAASEQPTTPEAMPSEPSDPSDPAEPIPGDTSQTDPDPAMPPAAQAPSDPASPPSAAEAPQPIEPAAPKSAEADSGMQFLDKQQTSDYLASNLIGESVYNAQDEVIGDINDLVSDESGKFVAVLIGAGGFLGMGEKDVALRFEDLKFARDENNDIKIVSDVSEEMLASAPDYERLSEQDVTVGATDRGAEQ